MAEVPLLLPDEEGVAQGGEDETGQDLPGVGVRPQEAEPMRQQEDPEAEDGEALYEGAEPRGAGGRQPQHEVDTSGLEEGHQLGTLTLHLRSEKRTTELHGGGLSE